MSGVRLKIRIWYERLKMVTRGQDFPLLNYPGTTFHTGCVSLEDHALLNMRVMLKWTVYVEVSLAPCSGIFYWCRGRSPSVFGPAKAERSSHPGRDKTSQT